jgi:hypothetical protein
MKKGACFICEERGHLAREHQDYMKKKKANIRGATIPSNSPGPSKPQNIKEIHALLQGLSTEEMKELLALQSSNQEKEDDLDF